MKKTTKRGQKSAKNKLSSRYYKLKCVSCKKEYSEDQTYTCCIKCGSPLDVIYDYDALLGRLNTKVLKTAPLKATKYMDFYPINDLRSVVTLDEGGTPLYHAKNLGKKLGLKNLYIKYEGANPTGAFKDRGSMVELTKTLEFGSKSVICASTGNMAASVSAYAAKANIPCYVLVPQGTPIGKLSQTLAYGARLIEVRGTYNDAANLTEEISKKHNFQLTGDYAFRMEGMKSIAYEIIEQLDWETPDKVIVPVGCGTNLAGIWKGFREFKHLDLVNNSPNMIAVQGKLANPVISAFKKKKKKADIVEKPYTIASAISIGDPLDGEKALSALYESKGDAFAVDDATILEAEKMMAKLESIYVEPASATSLAALMENLKSGKIDKSDKIVLIATGAGLKDPKTILKVLPSPPTVEPEIGEVEKFLKYGSYEVASGVSDRVMLIKKHPTLQKLGSIIKKYFALKLDKQDLKYCLEEIDAFISKGKEISKSDLQLIIDGALGRVKPKDMILKIIDYKIEVGKTSKPIGSVTLNYNGKTINMYGMGVGPVDTLINAVRTALKKEKTFKYRLVDYKVEISSRGTDATVDVQMTLKDEKYNMVIAQGTSPDIIAASLEAFEKGYNILYLKNKKTKR
ncbi:threonine synthase [Nanoarchaeota archaeon]